MTEKELGLSPLTSMSVEVYAVWVMEVDLDPRRIDREEHGKIGEVATKFEWWVEWYYSLEGKITEKQRLRI